MVCIVQSLGLGREIYFVMNLFPLEAEDRQDRCVKLPKYR